MVLSIRTYSKSGVSVKVWKSHSLTPECDHNVENGRELQPICRTRPAGHASVTLPAIHKIAFTNSRLSTALHPSVPAREMIVDPAPLLVCSRQSYLDSLESELQIKGKSCMQTAPKPAGRSRAKKRLPRVPMPAFLRPWIETAPSGYLVTYKSKPILKMNGAGRTVRGAAGLSHGACHAKSLHHRTLCACASGLLRQRQTIGDVSSAIYGTAARSMVNLIFRSDSVL